ncbi:hypothetical protein KCU81_g3092, partial [Aureobasidium melanogenum]
MPDEPRGFLCGTQKKSRIRLVHSAASGSLQSPPDSASGSIQIDNTPAADHSCTSSTDHQHPYPTYPPNAPPDLLPHDLDSFMGDSGELDFTHIDHLVPDELDQLADVPEINDFSNFVGNLGLNLGWGIAQQPAVDPDQNPRSSRQHNTGRPSDGSNQLPPTPQQPPEMPRDATSPLHSATRLQMLWLLVPTTGKSAKLRAEDVSIMQEAFKRWKAAWQTSPEASLDPTNPEGPMSFVSATFLALAYVRLQVDLGPFRLLQTRDPVAIGLALYNSPLPCRGQDLISPLLHSAHSLDVVVRLGIHYVSHHQTFFWSVQHCIAVLECAVLLVQWLRVLESPGENRGLSHLEEQIFKWTEFLIGEARESLASDGSGADRTVAESQGMASTILRIWAGIFRSNKMWPIVQCIGDGLHHFANMIEKPN